MPSEPLTRADPRPEFRLKDRVESLPQFDGEPEAGSAAAPQEEQTRPANMPAADAGHDPQAGTTKPGAAAAPDTAAPAPQAGPGAAAGMRAPPGPQPPPWMNHPWERPARRRQDRAVLLGLWMLVLIAAGALWLSFVREDKSASQAAARAAITRPALADRPPIDLSDPFDEAPASGSAAVRKEEQPKPRPSPSAVTPAVTAPSVAAAAAVVPSAVVPSAVVPSVVAPPVVAPPVVAPPVAPSAAVAPVRDSGKSCSAAQQAMQLCDVPVR
jgi:hypothetical protein